MSLICYIVMNYNVESVALSVTQKLKLDVRSESIENTRPGGEIGDARDLKSSSNLVPSSTPALGK